MIGPRILVKQFPHLCEYHVTEILSNDPGQRFDRPIRDSSEKLIKKLGLRGESLIRYLITVDGVVSLFISPYLLVVTKGEAFSFDDIDPGVIIVLTNIFTSRGIDPRDIKIERGPFLPS